MKNNKIFMYILVSMIFATVLCYIIHMILNDEFTVQKYMELNPIVMPDLYHVPKI